MKEWTGMPLEKKVVTLTVKKSEVLFCFLSKLSLSDPIILQWT